MVQNPGKSCENTTERRRIFAYCDIINDAPGALVQAHDHRIGVSADERSLHGARLGNATEYHYKKTRNVHVSLLRQQNENHTGIANQSFF